MSYLNMPKSTLRPKIKQSIYHLIFIEFIIY